MDSTSELKYVQLPNEEIYAYRESGNSEKFLILLHGNMSSSKFYYELTPLLTENFKVISPDLRGFGHTTYKTPIESHEDFADDLKLFMVALKIQKAVILGWSASGPIVMIFAAKYPEFITHSILMSSIDPRGFPLLRTNNDGIMVPYNTKEELREDKRIASIIEALQTKNKKFIKMIYDLVVFSGKKPEEKIYEIFLDEIVLQRHYLDIVYANHLFNITDEDNGISKGTGLLKSVKIKTLILHGDKDLIIKASSGEEWAKLLGPLATFKILKDCGHAPIIDSLAELAESIISFITSS